LHDCSELSGSSILQLVLHHQHLLVVQGDQAKLLATALVSSRENRNALKQEISMAFWSSNLQPVRHHQHLFVV
jgi:hypothetical protein